MRVLVVAAHPDDEVLGCGGTIAKLVHEGSEVHIAILGEGMRSRYRNQDQAHLPLIEVLHSCSREAAETLGAEDILVHNLPDNCFDTVPLLDVITIVEDLVATLSPQVVYTHHGGDLNVDHSVTHRAVLTAMRPVQGQPVREIYAFEVASSTEWAFHSLSPVFHPNVFVDISDTLETKLQALSCYKTEIHPFPHPRSAAALRVIARRWGSVVGCEAAEAFELIRAIR